MKIDPVILSNIKRSAQIKFSQLNKMVEKVDSFEKTTNPITKQNIECALPFKIIGNVSDDFMKKVTQEIKNCPQDLISLFNKNNYKIIFSDSINNAYKSQGITDFDLIKKESLNPSGILGVTHHSTDSNTNFFCFCDKGDISKKYIKNIINHEFGHGFVNINGLYKNDICISALKTDLKNIVKEKKLDGLTKEERKLISHYFFSKTSNMPVDEIMADLVAWKKCNCGCYGSELICNKNNPNLMKILFPQLYKTIPV